MNEDEKPKNEHLRKCYDPRGVRCFANTWDNKCKCLGDTRFKSGKCPFFKTVHQVNEECPTYFDDLKKGYF